MDRRSHQRNWGRARKGKRTGSHVFFIRGIRCSVMPIMGAMGLISWYITVGSINQVKFNAFVEQVLVSQSR